MDNDIIFFHKLEEMKIINITTLRDTLGLFLFYQIHAVNGAQFSSSVVEQK